MRGGMEGESREGIEGEMIIEDERRTDDSVELSGHLAEKWPDHIRVIHHAKNRGKGAAIRSALDYARGEFSIIQDADLEYDPRDYEKLLIPDRKSTRLNSSHT